MSIYKEYTQENCLLECRARLLLDKCGCLPYYYPRLDLILRERTEFAHLRTANNNNTSGCDWNGWNCLANSTELLDAIFPVPKPPSRFQSRAR